MYMAKPPKIPHASLKINVYTALLASHLHMSWEWCSEGYQMEVLGLQQ